VQTGTLLVHRNYFGQMPFLTRPMTNMWDSMNASPYLSASALKCLNHQIMTSTEDTGNNSGFLFLQNEERHLIHNVCKNSP